MEENETASTEIDLNGELRSEYDLWGLRVRKVGTGRRGFGQTNQREPHAAESTPEVNAKEVD